jgi:hypothetical protein
LCLVSAKLGDSLGARSPSPVGDALGIVLGVLLVMRLATLRHKPYAVINLVVDGKCQWSGPTEAPASHSKRTLVIESSFQS